MRMPFAFDILNAWFRVGLWLLGQGLHPKHIAYEIEFWEKRIADWERSEKWARDMFDNTKETHWLAMAWQDRVNAGMCRKNLRMYKKSQRSGL